ncbi:hypothetical protein VaNZ11_004325 [Volvox africanus]|uniref:Uncharacterized protein n=1 Tax=Volvox africanus TaxID=51714 RepID=A0ABQ5RW18_9CHLO|nr:hypothetical protein VaNZ11_004325 [Volvox africanus]
MTAMMVVVLGMGRLGRNGEGRGVLVFGWRGRQGEDGSVAAASRQPVGCCKLAAYGDGAARWSGKAQKLAPYTGVKLQRFSFGTGAAALPAGMSEGLRYEGRGQQTPRTNPKGQQ